MSSGSPSNGSVYDDFDKRQLRSKKTAGLKPERRSKKTDNMTDGSVVDTVNNEILSNAAVDSQVYSEDRAEKLDRRSKKTDKMTDGFDDSIKDDSLSNIALDSQVQAEDRILRTNKTDKVKVSSIDDIVPEMFSSRFHRIRDLIDRRGDYIGIKRMRVQGQTGFPERIPNRIYIWFPHFLELHKLLEDVIKSEAFHTGKIIKWTKFVECQYERDMYERQPVHKDIYSEDCFRCRNYVGELENLGIWWFKISNDKCIRMTFKNFFNDPKCCIMFIKMVGMIEVELKVEGVEQGSDMRRNFRVAAGSSQDDSLTSKGRENAARDSLSSIDRSFQYHSANSQSGHQNDHGSSSFEASSFEDFMSRNNISTGSVPEYQSSPDTKELHFKRPKVEKYMKLQEFPNSNDAEQFIKQDGCWSIYTSKDTTFGEKVFYRCNKAKLRGKQCDSGAYLLYDSSTPKVMMYKSDNDHSCDKDGNSSKRVKLNAETKQFIENAFIDGVRGRKQMQAKLNRAKIPLPSNNQLNNFLAYLRNKCFGPTTISLNELRKFCIEHSPIPEDPDKSYVVDFFIDDEDDGNFRCFISTTNLLKNAINREVLSADSTYKMVWEGFPLSPIGTTDQDRHFHLYGTLLSKTEAGEDFEFAFLTIKAAVKKIHNFDMKPTVLISDAAAAIHNAAKSVFGTDIIIRMCWFHMKKALKANLPQLIKDKPVENAILNDVDKLQLSQNPEMFNRASMLFLKKYNKYKEFCEYFDEVWLIQNRNWYEGCTPIPSPSTNNALESWNSLIKKEKSFRNRYPMNQFLDIFLEWHFEWSQEYSSGAKTVIEIPTIKLDLFTKSYNWARLNKLLKGSTDNNGSKCYDIAAGTELSIKNWSLLNNWTTFDQYKNRAFIGWKIVWEDNWRNSICNCPSFMKTYICKHVLGIGIRKNVIQVPMEAKNVPIGKKRKRGRPSKARKALIVQ